MESTTVKIESDKIPTDIEVKTVFFLYRSLRSLL